MMDIRILLLVMLVMFSGGVVADTGKPPRDIKDTAAEGFDFWIYNDIGKAMAEAKRTGKPLFVTFRCLPCVNCMGFDAEVAAGRDGIAKLARDEFISVRQIEMKGVDLWQFQFDYDLSWAAMFINADGTVYARYGTQSAEGADAYNSIESLKNTMKRVLELHKNYPNNKAELKDKKGLPKAYKTPLEMPGMENRSKLAGTTQRNNCVHCHNIHDALYVDAYKKGTFELEQMYRYPLPENIGVTMNREHGLKVESVKRGSASAYRLKAGDILTHAEGQVLTSIADLQWVLDGVKGNSVELKVNRDGKEMAVKLNLKAGWRKSDFTWRASMWAMRPRPGFWSPTLEEKRIKSLKLPEGAKPMLVKWINTGTPEGRVAQQAGLRHGDIITEVDGVKWDKTPKDLHIHVRMKHKPGDMLRLKVLRGGQEKMISIKLVDGF